MIPSNWNTDDDSRTDHRSDLDVLLTTGLTAAVSLCIASFAPRELVPAITAELTFCGALASGIYAALQREPIWCDRLTLWDQVLMLFWLSMLATAFTDPAAVAEFTAAAPVTDPAGTENTPGDYRPASSTTFEMEGNVK